MQTSPSTSLVTNQHFLHELNFIKFDPIFRIIFRYTGFLAMQLVVKIFMALFQNSLRKISQNLDGRFV
jgi:hypothetical protein